MSTSPRNLPIDYDPDYCSLVIECSNNSAVVLAEENQAYYPYDPRTNPSQSQGGTPSFTSPEEHTFFKLEAPLFPKQGFRFGTRKNVDFRLPTSKGYTSLSGLHFRIIVNEHRSWMLIDHSKNGTVVNKETLPLHRTNVASQIALHPERANYIELGGLAFNIYTVGNLDWLKWINYRLPQQTTRADFHALINFRNENNPEIRTEAGRTHTRTQTRTRTYTRSSVATSSLGIEEGGRPKYHILEHPTLSSSGQNRVVKVIQKSTGMHAVGKILAVEAVPAGMNQYRKLLDILKSHNNFLSFIETTLIGTQLMVVSEYMRGDTLQAIIRPWDRDHSVDFIILYIQIMAGLKWLESHSIIHRHIRPAVILVDPNNKQHCLTGFSEFCTGPTATGVVGSEDYRAPEIVHGSTYDAKVDVYSLSAVIQGYFPPCNNLSTLLDSEITSIGGLENDPTHRPSASQVCDLVNGLVGGYEWPPFGSFMVTRRLVMSTLFGNDDKDPQLIRTSDFLKTLYFYHTDSDIKMLLGEQITVAGVSYSHLRNARKVCHRFELSRLKEDLDLVFPGVDRATYLSASSIKRTTTVTHVLCSNVFYHKPSAMVNISHFWKALDLDEVEACKGVAKPTIFQEIYGEPEWEGFYVDHQCFDSMMSCVNEKEQLLRRTKIQSEENPTLLERFTMVDTSQYIILVTAIRYPNMMLLRRSDCFVNINQLNAIPCLWTDPPLFVAADGAARACEIKGLHVLRDAIRRLSTEDTIAFDVNSIYRTTCRVDLDGECEHGTTITTVESFRAKEDLTKAEFEEEDMMRFRFKTRDDVIQEWVAEVNETRARRLPKSPRV